MGIVTGLAAVKPDPAAAARNPILDAALEVAVALSKLLGFRRDCTSAVSVHEQAEATSPYWSSPRRAWPEQPMRSRGLWSWRG
ncbi:MAG: hypothetical protein M3083_16085 [Actinomycetota bacterium]|nr:hypothetical protein [Actinomycetota bacterium]MDQ6948038.1 hypothetical protein [Actinomycetota bacterium]